jgi:hypothetical protein
MSISFVNGDSRKDCPVWGPEDEEFFPMEMEEKVRPKDVWGCGHNFIPRPVETVPKNFIKITFINVYLCTL